MSTPNGYQWNQGNPQQPQYPHYQTPYANGPQPAPTGGPWPSDGATDAAPWYKRWYFWAVAALAVILVGVLIWLIVSMNGSKDTDAQQETGSGQSTTSQSQDANGTTQRGGKTKNDATDTSDGEDMSDDTDAFECDANGYCRMKNYGHYAPDYDKMMDDNSGAGASDAATGDARASDNADSLDKMNDMMMMAVTYRDPSYFSAYMTGIYRQLGVSDADCRMLEDLNRRLVEDLIKLTTEKDPDARQAINDDYDGVQDRIDEILDKY